MIKFFDIGRQYQRDKDVYLGLADQVFSSGQMVNGPHCAALTQALKTRSGRAHVILTGSCTDALALVGEYLMTPDTTVFFPLISFPATNNGFLRGVKHGRWAAEYVDVDFYRLISLFKLDHMLASCTTPKKVVVWANLFGNTVDYRALDAIAVKYGAVLVEDAAQSYGASWDGIKSGGMGSVSTLSFDPTKNLNAFGMGGAILTDNAKLAEFVELTARPHTGKWINRGHNSQMNELDAAVVCWKLENRFEEWQARRAEIAEYYSLELQEYASSCHITPNRHPVNPHIVHVGANHKFVIDVKQRELIQAEMLERGVETKVHYPKTLIPAPGTNAESYVKTGFSLPLYPELSDVEVERVAEVAIAAVKKILKPSPIIHT